MPSSTPAARRGTPRNAPRSPPPSSGGDGRAGFAFGVLSFLTVAAVVASLVAFVALRRSQDNEAEAEDRFAAASPPRPSPSRETHPKLALLLGGGERGAASRRLPPKPSKRSSSARVALASSDIVPNGEPIPVGDVLTALVTPDGSTIVTGARDGTVRLWDAPTGRATATLTGPTGGVEEAAVDPSGRWLVAVGRGGAWRWDLDRGVDRRRAGRPPARAPVVRGVLRRRDAARHRGRGRRRADLRHPVVAAARRAFTVFVDFLSVTFTPDGKRLLAGTGTGRCSSGISRATTCAARRSTRTGRTTSGSSR